MLNVKETLKNLHKEFPELTIDKLLTILDCYIEEYQMPAPHYRSEPLNSNKYDRTISKPDYISSRTCNLGSKGK